MHHTKTNTPHYTSERIRRRQAERAADRRHQMLETAGVWLGLAIFTACVLIAGAIDAEVAQICGGFKAC